MLNTLIGERLIFLVHINEMILDHSDHALIKNDNQLPLKIRSIA